MKSGTGSASTECSVVGDELCRSVLWTVLYSDLFDQALTLSEVRRFLVLRRASAQQVEQAIARCGPWLEVHGDLVTWGGRADLVEWRAERDQRSEAMWQQARTYSQRLQRLPWVRMVAVCGSLAVNNARPDGDIDLFIVTAPHRLWLVQVMAMLVRRLAARRGIDLCPNYFLTEESLAVRGRGLFVAREVVQAVPMTGLDVHAKFRSANPWIEELLPNVSDLPQRRPPGGSATMETAKSVRLEKWLERLGLGGVLVGWADRLTHRFLLRYYSIRLRHRGLTRARLAGSYRSDRQEVVTGGYARAVEETFRARVAEAFGSNHPGVQADLTALFSARDEVQPDPNYARLLEAHYGPAQEGVGP